MKNEMANMQCNLTVAFQTAGWSFYHRLKIHILTDSDYPNQAFSDGKEGDRVSQKGKVQSQVPNVTDKIKIKIKPTFGDSQAFLHSCVFPGFSFSFGKILPLFWETQLGFWSREVLKAGITQVPSAEAAG